MATIENETLLEALRELGDPPDDPPTVKEMSEEGPYSEWVYYDRWGSWPAALDAAGYETVPGRGRKRVPDDSLIFDLRLGAVVLGHAPSYDEYDNFGSYAASTLAQRFGGWGGALEAADLPESGTEVDLTHEDVDVPGVA